MGEGLIQATLAALRTQGPWRLTARTRVFGEPGVTVTLTGDLLVELYEAIVAGRNTADALVETLREGHPELMAAPPHTHFPYYLIQDKGCQRLRKAGLVRWDRLSRRWRVAGGP